MNFDMKKYFYIDEQGNKKKYVGNVIKNEDGTLSGVLTKTIYTDREVELKYNEDGKNIIDSITSYYYIDNDNNKIEIDLNDIHVTSDNKFIEFVNKKDVELIYHQEIKASTYYTYFNSKTKANEHYNGEVKFDEKSNSYYGFV